MSAQGLIQVQGADIHLLDRTALEELAVNGKLSDEQSACDQLETAYRLPKTGINRINGGSIDV